MRLSVLDPAAALRSRQDLMTELQAVGLRLEDDGVGAPSRKGGAGPSDHKAVTIDGQTLMVPVHTGLSKRSPFSVKPDATGGFVLKHLGVAVGPVTFPDPPRFYGQTTSEGVPYWKIAVLHSADVLATTVMQTCIRYQPAETACQFCSIGQSLEAGRTLRRKTPAQLAEVAEAAVRLDGVKHMILTTGTPNHTDRGARVLAESAFAIRGAVDLPIQAQCEPPDDFAWFETPEGRGRGRAGHAPGSGRAGGAGPHHAGQGRGAGGGHTWTPSPRGSRCLAGAR